MRIIAGGGTPSTVRCARENSGSPALLVQLMPGGSGQGIERSLLCRSHASPRSRTDSWRGASPKPPSSSTGSQLSHCFTCTKSAGEPEGDEEQRPEALERGKAEAGQGHEQGGAEQQRAGVEPDGNEP